MQIERGYQIYLIYLIAKPQCLPGIGAFRSLHYQPAYATMLFTSDTKGFSGAALVTLASTLQVDCKHGLSLRTQPLLRILCHLWPVLPQVLTHPAFYICDLWPLVSDWLLDCRQLCEAYAEAHVVHVLVDNSIISRRW